MIRQVCYMSAAASGLSDTAIFGLLDAARAANGRAGLTGLLAAGGGLFFQLIEGPRDSVEALMQSIRRDRRHAHLRVLFDDETAQRLFAGCPMGFRALDPDALRLIAARTVAGGMAPAEMIAVLGDPQAAAKMPHLPLAA